MRIHSPRHARPFIEQNQRPVRGSGVAVRKPQAVRARVVATPPAVRVEQAGAMIEAPAPMIERTELRKTAIAAPSRPTLVLHTNLKILDPFVDTIRRLGFAVERQGYELHKIKDPAKVHLVWGMSQRPPVYEELAKLPHVYFMENGWFTQRTGFYIDKAGPNGLSSIRNMQTAIAEIDTSGVDEQIAALHKRVNLNPAPNPGYIFVPLQVERDTQLLFWSNAPVQYPHRQAWLVEEICKAFPHDRIVIRPHPRNTVTAERIKKKLGPRVLGSRVEFHSDRTSYDYIASAKAVVGFNSTVLLEALTLFKPVAAMGTGLFAGNGVTLECNGEPRMLSRVASFLPPSCQICRFLALLFQRQIPYDILPEKFEQYPVLSELMSKLKKL